jgi:hypothetical protein
MAQTTHVEEALGRVFDILRDELRGELTPDEYQRRKSDFIFHMLDGKDDVDRFVRWVDNPDTVDAEEATTVVTAFLIHVVPHLTAASRLLLDKIDDPFAEKQ